MDAIPHVLFLRCGRDLHSWSYTAALFHLGGLPRTFAINTTATPVDRDVYNE